MRLHSPDGEDELALSQEHRGLRWYPEMLIGLLLLIRKEYSARQWPSSPVSTDGLCWRGVTVSPYIRMEWRGTSRRMTAGMPPFLVASPSVWLKKDWTFLDHSFGCLDGHFAEKPCDSVITAIIQCLPFLFPTYDMISSLPALNIVAWISLIQKDRELFTSSEGPEVSRSQSFKRTVQSPASRGLHC